MAALASAGPATMSFFIPLPQLVGRSRPVRRDEAHSPCIGSRARQLERDRPAADRSVPSPGFRRSRQHAAGDKP